jgi:EcsC family protein
MYGVEAEMESSPHGTEIELARRMPDSLWERLKADPWRAAEHIALAASERHAPAAAAWVAEKRAMYAYDGPGLAKMAKRKHAKLARVGGALTGVGGIYFALPDLAALAWIQSRLVFFTAAAYGYDPYDRMRPAELLVLQQVYSDPWAAREALDGLSNSTVAEQWVGNRLSQEGELHKRLLRFVGMRVAERGAGRLIPGLGLIINAVGNERDTRALADRCMVFYGGTQAP